MYTMVLAVGQWLQLLETSCSIPLDSTMPLVNISYFDFVDIFLQALAETACPQSVISISHAYHDVNCGKWLHLLQTSCHTPLDCSDRMVFISVGIKLDYNSWAYLRQSARIACLFTSLNITCIPLSWQKESNFICFQQVVASHWTAFWCWLTFHHEFIWYIYSASSWKVYTGLVLSNIHA